jgi:hypothetical protein
MKLFFILCFFFRHDFHTSLTQAEYNPSSASFEISMRVFTDDLEKALANDNHIQLTSLEKMVGADQKIEVYVKKAFSLEGNSKIFPLKYIGRENDTDVTWLYMEVPVPAGLKVLTVKNAVLTELYEDEANIINLQFKSKKGTLLCRRGDEKKDFSLE